MGGYMRAWDRRSAGHVDLFLANSSCVAWRIKQCYGRDSTVVHSPIDVSFFTPSGEPPEDYYLMVTALSPYKRVDQAIAAFAQLGRPLRIIGGGPLLRELRRSAPPNVTLMGHQSDEVVREHYRRCQAIVFPGEEDFGLVPLEAMACGRPVIAYSSGGATETVMDPEGPSGRSPTGVLYAPQTPEALAAAVRRFERIKHLFQPDALSEWARQFGPDNFRRKFIEATTLALARKGLPQPW
jgi:glycosyltransferase involved in cell wall biosynthesis